jgi:hypothetical protein
MNFNLKKPCPDCPFLKGSNTNTTLHPARIPGIVRDLLRGSTFQCHKTLGKEKAEHCAGALLYLEREEAPNQLMRIAERLGSYDPDMLEPCPNIIERVYK